MELVNATRMAADYTLGIDPSGREYLVVVIKGTFDIPQNPEETASLSATQVPVLLADVMGGASGLLPLVEADLCLRKLRCDVILHGAAYAPGGRPVRAVAVGVRIGEWTKMFRVTGDRVWLRGARHLRPSEPEPFQVQRFSYERAFGGSPADPGNPSRIEAYLANPVGCGYAPKSNWVADGAVMPITEEMTAPIEQPTERYRPMSLGPVGRNWYPRYPLAGTYDRNWLDNVFPFLPDDFSEAYYQAAPIDQQIPFPQGGEPVVLQNLSAEGQLAFRLPRTDACVFVAPRAGELEQVRALVDTVILDLDERRFSLCWRTSRPLRRDLFEIDEVIVGNVSSRFLRDRDGIPLPFPNVPRRGGGPGS